MCDFDITLLIDIPHHILKVMIADPCLHDLLAEIVRGVLWFFHVHDTVAGSHHLCHGLL